MIYSHSRIEAFDSCRLKFKYRYIERPDVIRRESIEAFLGSRVHDTLEQLYRNKMMCKEWSRDEFLKFYQNQWQRNKSEALFIVKKEYSEEDYYRQGLECLEKYWDHYYPFDQEKNIALEKRLMFDLDDGGRYRMQGFIDRLSRTEDGVWQIRDYKTKRSLATQEEADKDRQLALYQVGVQNMWQDTERVELIWHYVIFDEEIKSVRTRQQLESLKIDTVHRIQEIESAVEKGDFPYRESQLCEWCDYFDICPAKKHLASVRLLPLKEFKEDEGVKLVDQYASLKSEEAAIKGTLDKAREEIIQFAKQFGTDRVVGSDKSVKVVHNSMLKPPASSDKDLRSRFEEFLREKGLWEVVSSFNSRRFEKLFKDGEFSPALSKEMESYLTPRESHTLRISKRKDRDNDNDL